MTTPDTVTVTHVRLHDIIAALEGRSNNTDTDPYWQAAQTLRRSSNYPYNLIVLEVRHHDHT